jgi:pentatricopeptide repeat protein
MNINISVARNIAKEKRKAEREKAKNGGTTAETPVTTPVAPIKISKPPNRETKPPNPIKESTTFNLLLKSIGTPAFTSFNTQPAPEPVSTPVEKIESVRSYVEEDFNVMIERCGAKGDLEMMVVWFNDMIALNVKPSYVPA